MKVIDNQIEREPTTVEEDEIKKLGGGQWMLRTN